MQGKIIMDHSSASRLTRIYRIPIRIKNVVNPKGGGTLIEPDEPDSGSQSGTRSSSNFTDAKPKRPTAVTVKDRITLINVHSNKRTILPDFYQGIFSILSKWRLSVDLISTSEVHISLALHSVSEIISGGSDDDLKIVNVELKSAIEELKQYGDVKLFHNMAILSLVGKQLKHMMGIAGKMFSLLGGKKMSSQSSIKMLTYSKTIISILR